MRLARRGRHFRNFECRYCRKDGSVAALTWSGVWSEPKQEYFLIGRDMTEQKLAQEKFALAVEASPSGIVMVDATGAIVLVNAETERMFGYGREQLIGQPIESLLPLGLRAAHLRDRKEFVARPERRRMGVGRDLFGVRKDGTEFPVEIGLNPISTREGLLVLSSIVDITARKKAQQALLERAAGARHHRYRARRLRPDGRHRRLRLEPAGGDALRLVTRRGDRAARRRLDRAGKASRAVRARPRRFPEQRRKCNPGKALRDRSPSARWPGNQGRVERDRASPRQRVPVQRIHARPDRKDRGGGAIPAIPEDGSGRAAYRRHCSRLQQHAHRDHRDDRNPGGGGGGSAESSPRSRR